MSHFLLVGAGATANATAKILAARGDTVRMISRRGAGVEHPNVERIAADATDAARVTDLARGADVVFNCAMPPYDRWPEEFPPLATATLAAVESVGAKYVIVGNVYGYGPVTGEVDERTPLAPTTRKGRVRAAMWEQARRSGARVAELRAGSFLGAGAISLFQLLVAVPLRRGEIARYPGDLDAVGPFTYVDDVARGLVALADANDDWGRAWHAPVTLASVRDVTARFARFAGLDDYRLEPLPHADLARAAETDTMAREVLEMEYLHEAPFRMSAAETCARFSLTATALDDAVRATATS